MNRTRFKKQALASADLIALLERKGLLVPDKACAERTLAYVGYYRLKIYMRAFQDQAKIFEPNTYFDDIVKLYDFDRRLRLISLDAIERIEVALRSHCVNVVAVLHGPHYCYSAMHFDNPNVIKRIQKIAKGSDQASIKHYRKKYYEPVHAPIWCITEGTTFGDLSRIYSSLKKDYRKQIAAGFGIPERVAVSWMRSISYLRNVCAHHGQVWNHDFHVNAPERLRRPRDHHEQMADLTSAYARFFVLRFLLQRVEQDGGAAWAKTFVDHLEAHPEVPRALMGIPSNWLDHPFWR